MMRTLYRRDSLFMRILSGFVAFSFAMSIAGPGFAVSPQPKGSTPPESSVAEVVEEAPEVTQEEAPEEVVAPPVEVPDEESSAPSSEPSVEAEPTTPSVEEPSAEKEPQAPESASSSLMAAAAVVAPFATFQQVDWQAWRVSPAAQVGWQKSNLGQYREGDWIPVRIMVDNTDGDSDVVLPSFAVNFDHYDSGKNAIAVDGARAFGFGTYASLPSAQVPSGGYSALSTFAESGNGSTQYYGISFSPVGDYVIPQGEWGVVYMEVHLALTQYWQTQSPARFGAKEYPGSSAQGRFISWNGEGVGQNTISVPVGQAVAPTGRINGVKFNDLNRNGVRDSGEPGLSGWSFTLAYSGEFPFTAQTVSATDGTFSFTALPAGDYSVTETQQSPWMSSTPNPLALVLARDEVKSVSFGNYLPDVTKTWSLSMDTVPMGAVPFVSYTVNGTPAETALTGSGPFTAQISVPVGAVIADVAWYVEYDGVDVLLGTSSGETMTANKTNSFTYDSSVSGVKFSDDDGDGARDLGEAGLSSWNIVLKRVVGSVETTYAQALSVAGGAYSFADVIPGTYKVYEIQQAGWHNTVAPVASFTVSNNVHRTGLDFGNLEVANGISLEKSGPAAVHVGDTITYNFTVTNSGNYTLTGVTVTDPMLALSYPVGTLAAGASVSFTATLVASAEPDPIVNTALAMGYDVFGGMVSDDDGHVVDIIKPAITIEKSAAPATVIAGSEVLYTFVVTNSGEDTLTGVALSDDHVSVTGSSIGMLAPGAQVSLEATANLSVTTTNIATVVGYDALGMMVDATDSAVVSVYNPSISIVKTSDPGVVLEGGIVTYTYLVTNTGDITLHDIEVIDDILGPVGTISSLAPNAFEPVTITVPIAQDVTNIGTAIGQYGEEGSEFYGEVRDSSSAYVEVVAPAIQVLKSADRTAVVAGELVTYSFTVTNIGDVTLYDVVVHDDHLGHIGEIGMLGVGEQVVLEMAHELMVTTTNTVMVSGEDQYGHPVTDDDVLTVPVYNPAIGIEKSAAPDTILSGATVTYAYVVSNTGDVELHDVSVEDDKLGHIGTVSILAVGDSATLYMEAAISVDTENIGEATGHYGEPESDFHGTVSDEDDALVNVIAPAVEVIKSASASPVLAGTLVTYSFLVRNTGDVALVDLAVDDDHLGHIGDIASLAVGEEVTLEKTSAIEVSTTNIVVVEGSDELENPVSDEDSATVSVVTPAISVSKTPSAVEIFEGESVTYTYTVTNTGDVDLFGVELVDDKLGIVGTLETLAVGASATFQASADLFEPTTNIVIASGADEFGHEVTDEAEAFVDVGALPFSAPDLTIEKSADKTIAMAGDTVRYTLTYENIGEGYAMDATIVDDFDERYVTVIDAAGGTVADGKITWAVAAPFGPEDGVRTISYTVRIDEDLPASVSVVRNTVVIDDPFDDDPTNNTDTWSVEIDDFLPFTGGELGIVIAVALMMAALGLFTRRLAIRSAS